MSAPSSAGASTATVDLIKQKAKLLSIYSMMSTTAAGSGHPTSCMSAAQLVAGVFFYAMKFDPKNANSNDDDRFVLSKGHAAPLLYSALAEAGVFPVSRVMTLRPPCVSRISPVSASRTSTRIPRRSASSAMMRA